MRKHDTDHAGDQAPPLLGGGPVAREPAGNPGGIPAGFQGLAEALAGQPVPAEADLVRQVCRVLGARLAGDGHDLPDALAGLRTTTHKVLGREPSYAEVEALACAWGESTLAYAHSISCEDPLTGLSTLAHLRSRLAELYRIREHDRHALVALDLPRDPHPDLPEDPVLGHALRLARAASVARGVFGGTETIARAGSARILVLARRDERLARRVRLLRTLLGGEIRSWVEGLPESEAYAGGVLDELARA